MKKLVFISAMAAVLCWFTLRVADANSAPFRIVVSEDPPADSVMLFLKFVQSKDFVKISQEEISRQESNLSLYVVVLYARKNSPAADVPDVYVLVQLTPPLDNGNAAEISDKYILKIAGIIFVDERVAWFMSEEAKSVFIKATE